MRTLRFLIISALALCFAIPALAQQPSPTPLSVQSSRQYADGLDRVFEFQIANALNRELRAEGRLVVINVYDTSKPESIPVKQVVVPPGGVTTVSVRWPRAPLFGQVRALLTLSDGENASMVDTTSFWILPYAAAAGFLGVVAFIVALALILMRTPKLIKERVPPNMLPYVVEFDDTVVTLSSRFDVTWQDIVRANRLKPPYELKQGSRILIPRHGLKRPTDAQKS